jgi:pimeloyl-ACP methyl ester carboxylesterase
MRLFIILGVFVLAVPCLAAPQKILIGAFQSRGILNIVSTPTGSPKAPMIILVPGSGPMGPEVMFPGKITMGGKDRLITTDGQDHSIFSGFTDPLNQAGVSTLAIGKPGVDFFSAWQAGWTTNFYDSSMFASLQWSDLVENVRQAVQYARQLPNVDPNRIYVLGHSEGTQVVADYAVTDPKLAGVILFGVVNDSFAVADAYQVFQDYVDNFVALSVDANHDRYVDRTEAAQWPKDFIWSWASGQQRVSLSDILAARMADPKLQAQYANRGKDKVRQQVYNRPTTIAQELTSLTIPIYLYTGALDVMAVPAQAYAFKLSCIAAKKDNCYLTVMPGLGHGFSPPIAPRAQPYLDYSFGPVAPEFQTELTALAQKILH